MVQDRFEENHKHYVEGYHHREGWRESQTRKLAGDAQREHEAKLKSIIIVTYWEKDAPDSLAFDSFVSAPGWQRFANRLLNGVREERFELEL